MPAINVKNGVDGCQVVESLLLSSKLHSRRQSSAFLGIVKCAAPLGMAHLHKRRIKIASFIKATLLSQVLCYLD